MPLQLSVSTEKFRKLLSTVLFHNTDSLLEKVYAVFTPEGLTIKDISLESLAVETMVSPRFFSTYNVLERTEVMLTDSLFSIIDKRFKGVETIDISVDESIQPSGKIIVNSRPTESNPRGPRYDEDLLTVTPTSFPIKTQPTEYGIVPTNALELSKIIASVKVDGFYNMPKTKEYAIISKDNQLTIHAKDVGNFYNPITTVSSVKNGDLYIKVNSDYLYRLVNNLDGECWFFASDMAINFTKTTEEVSTLLLLSTNELESQ